jgi:hypothetical protein
MLQLLGYSYEYDPKAVDCEEKNSEHFNKFADESGIPNVSEHKSSMLSVARGLHSWKIMLNFFYIVTGKERIIGKLPLRVAHH